MPYRKEGRKGQCPIDIINIITYNLKKKKKSQYPHVTNGDNDIFMPLNIIIMAKDLINK